MITLLFRYLVRSTCYKKYTAVQKLIISIFIGKKNLLERV